MKLRQRLYKDVINLILDYIPKYKLRDWVDEKKLDWMGLSLNSKAIDLLEKNLEEGIRYIGLIYLKIPQQFIYLRRTKVKFIGMVYVKIPQPYTYSKRIPTE